MIRCGSTRKNASLKQGSLRAGVALSAAPRREIPELITTRQKQHILFPYARTCAALSFDHLVRSVQQRLRNRHADLLRRFEINYQLEFCRLLNREISRLGTLENLVNIRGSAAVS